MRERDRSHAAPRPAEPLASTAPGAIAAVAAAVLVACLLSLAALPAMAQGERPREGEGVSPGLTEPGLPDGWVLVRPPTLPPGTRFGELWTSRWGEVYVWAQVPLSGRARFVADDTPGEILPPRRPNLPDFAARLYRLSKDGWSQALNVALESPGAVFGTGGCDVYASSTARDGSVSVWRWNGLAWSLEPLPLRVSGLAHAFAGAPGDVWLRVGEKILHREAEGWVLNHELPAGVGGGGIAYVARSQLIVPTSCGHCLFDGTAWHQVPEDFTFSGVHDAWGMRSPCGALCVYAVGCNEQDNGVRVWRFTEAAGGSLSGCWGGRSGTVVSDPPAEGIPWIGSAQHVWGEARNDVYVAGALAGRGAVYRFDGAAWQRHEPLADMPEVGGVSGTGRGQVWFSLVDGRLLRYQRPNHTPDVSVASPSVEMLWPPTSDEWVEVKVLGVHDVDGDVVTLRVLRVTQDEPVIEGLYCTTCPDAAVDGESVWLRAERANDRNGRVHEITFEADDGFGGVTRGHVRVCMSVEPNMACVDDGQVYESKGPCAWPPPGEIAVLSAEPDAARGFRFRYALRSPAEGTLDVHDVAGRVVARLAAGRLEAGPQAISWVGHGCRPGVYFVRLRAAGVNVSRTVILNR